MHFGTVIRCLLWHPTDWAANLDSEICYLRVSGNFLDFSEPQFTDPWNQVVTGLRGAVMLTAHVAIVAAHSYVNAFTVSRQTLSPASRVKVIWGCRKPRK